MIKEISAEIHVCQSRLEYVSHFVINTDVDGLMCIAGIEIFFSMFLLSTHLMMHICWKDVLQQAVNNILIFQNFICCMWPKILIADCSVDHRHYLNYVAVRNVRYSWRLSTAGTTLLFTESVNSSNIILYIQSFSVLNRTICKHFPHVPLQHQFHTKDCISQTVGSDLTITPAQKNRYICVYISYHQFTIQCFMEERESDI